MLFLGQMEFSRFFFYHSYLVTDVTVIHTWELYKKGKFSFWCLRTESNAVEYS